MIPRPTPTISLNQVDLRKNLKEIIVTVSEKDEDERDKMLDYVEKRMEKDEKQIQEALKTANMNAKIIKWLERDLQDKSKISNGWDTNG
jgi:hypothetical protein